MHFDVITLFPKQVQEMLNFSILERAQNSQLISIKMHDLRDWGLGKHKQVDDTPYGGGAGMVLKPDVVVPSIKDVSAQTSTKPHIVLLSPQGRRFTQLVAEELAQKKRLILVAGHYEGFDERIRDYVDDQISIGDFVLTGGELPAAMVIDAVSRLVPNVLTAGSAHEESHSLANDNGERVLEYPHYTKPEEFDDKKVPSVLLSGNHAEIAKWRQNKQR